MRNTTTRKQTTTRSTNDKEERSRPHKRVYHTVFAVIKRNPIQPGRFVCTALRERAILYWVRILGSGWRTARQAFFVTSARTCCTAGRWWGEDWLVLFAVSVPARWVGARVVLDRSGSVARVAVRHVPFRMVRYAAVAIAGSATDAFLELVVETLGFICGRKRWEQT